MNTWRVILATLVIFGAGVITGGVLVSYSDRALRPAPERPAPAPNPPGLTAATNPATLRDNRLPPVLAMPALLRKDFLDRLEHEIKLDIGQRERIEKILSEGQERTREVSQQTFRQIRGEMTPEQRARFEDLMKRGRDPRRPQPPRERPVTNLPSGVNADPVH